MIWPTAWTAAPSVRLYRNFLQETHCSTKSTLNYRCPGYLAGLSGLLKFVVLSIRPEPEYDGQIWYPDIWLYKQMALFQHWPDNLLLLENVNTQLLFMKNKNYQIPVRILEMYRCKKSHFLKVKTKLDPPNIRSLYHFRPSVFRSCRKSDKSVSGAFLTTI